jgi:ribosomal protein S18 acetylase RimI-like enzyme
MKKWMDVITRFAKADDKFLLVVEEDGKAVSTVQVAVIEGLTHNVRPFAVIENVVTHGEYQNRGFASALLEKATEIAKEFNCYKIFLETGSNKESTLNFYRKNSFVIDEKHSCLKRL